MQKFDILKLVLFWYFSVPAKSCIAVLPEVLKKGRARKSEPVACYIGHTVSKSYIVIA